MGMDDAYKMINQTLVSLINEIWELEEKAIITDDEFKDLTNNDMHVIEAVGLGEGNNMSSIARKLNITVGSLTTAMNSLVNKRYVERHRSEEDRRVVLVKLTEKGVKAYHHHYHRQMTQAILDKLDDTELPVLVKTLELSEFFTGYSESSIDRFFSGKKSTGDPKKKKICSIFWRQTGLRYSACNEA